MTEKSSCSRDVPLWEGRDVTTLFSGIEHFLRYINNAEIKQKQRLKPTRGMDQFLSRFTIKHSADATECFETRRGSW